MITDVILLTPAEARRIARRIAKKYAAEYAFGDLDEIDDRALHTDEGLIVSDDACVWVSDRDSIVVHYNPDWLDRPHGEGVLAEVPLP